MNININIDIITTNVNFRDIFYFIVDVVIIYFSFNIIFDINWWVVIKYISK